eukprot:CAMPEP_0119561442 /NCGR_PEP_ID=MMETSP1352-20130426/17645_1 /TAXON_ID=265584 /ORGANISM="Stauroneis constricta, Strain CCMP1120" /LENGTH=291 /DNA_ID=CAMNT_0007609651 /DNA_START=221 /DNA_END=1096 /DNA_ORIENTATION=+
MGTDGMRATAASFLRVLQEAQQTEDDGMMDGSANSDEKIFDSTVFWSVNAFVLFLILVMITCCVLGNTDWLTNVDQRRREADERYQASIREREREIAESKVETPEKRRKRLLQSFRRHKVLMTVTEDDLTTGTSAEFMANDNENSNNETESETVDVEMGDTEKGSTNGNNDEDDSEAPAGRSPPPPSLQKQNSLSSLNTGMLRLPNNRQPVPNCCAVCLGSYDVGESVVWSSNPQCAHAFHEECIIEWLIKMQPETPCPCCRQEFTDLEALRKEKKITWAGDTFSLSALRF